MLTDREIGDICLYVLELRATMRREKTEDLIRQSLEAQELVQKLKNDPTELERLTSKVLEARKEPYKCGYCGSSNPMVEGEHSGWPYCPDCRGV